MITRRGFMRMVAAGAAAVGFGGRVAVGQDGPNAKPQAAAGTSRAAAVSARPRSAADPRPLGDSGLKASLLGVGTGTNGVGGASNQTRLGHDGIVRLLRHAIDRGVTYFDLADQYGSHTYMRDVLRAPGVDRDRLFLLSKTHARSKEEAFADIDRFREELGVEQIDCLLLHCMTSGDWVQQRRGAMEAMSEAKARGVVRALGVSCHGWDPLVACRQPEAAAWIDIQLARINPWGTAMDGKPERVVPELAWMHERKRGVLGMKIFGGGGRTDDAERAESLKYVLGLGTVDAFTIGFETMKQFDATFDAVDAVLRA